MGNQDLDFEIPILDFAIECEIRSQGGFQLRNPNPDFMDFLFIIRNLKKDFQSYNSREQGSSFCQLCMRVQDRCS